MDLEECICGEDIAADSIICLDCGGVFCEQCIYDHGCDEEEDTGDD